MLRLPRVLHSIRIDITYPTSPLSKISSFLLQSPSLRPLRRISTTTATIDPSLTLYFLKKSCGLSAAAALAAAQKINIKSTKKPHAVLALLKDYSFSQAHIARLVSARPNLLLADAAKTLKPKLDFYRRLGFSDFDGLPRLLSSNSDLLNYSLSNRMIPNLDLLRTILQSDDAAIHAVKYAPFLLLADLKKTLLPNVEHLRDQGVPEPAIVKLIRIHPRVLIGGYCDFNRAYSIIKSTRISLASPMLAHALGVFGTMSEPMWKEKIENYKSLGWTEELVMKAFQVHPYCMATSMEKVRRNMEFFTGKYRWSPAHVSVNPVILSLSFEKRIVPRYLVFRILEAKGLMKGPVSTKYLMISEKKFLKKYVNKYQEEAPELIDAAEGKLDLSNWGDFPDLERGGEEIDQKQHSDVAIQT